MITAVRANTKTSVMVVAGAEKYAYDAASLVTLDKALHTSAENRIVFNFHPYMGPNQAGDPTKCSAGFSTLLSEVISGTDKPVIITEFGQTCCGANLPCMSCKGSYDGKTMGYDEIVLQMSELHSVSWLPWAWRPGAGDPGKGCMDINGGNLNGTSLMTGAAGWCGASMHMCFVNKTMWFPRGCVFLAFCQVVYGYTMSTNGRVSRCILGVRFLHAKVYG